MRDMRVASEFFLCSVWVRSSQLFNFQICNLKIGTRKTSCKLNLEFRKNLILIKIERIFENKFKKKDIFLTVIKFPPKK